MKTFHSSIDAWSEIEAIAPDLVLVGIEAPNSMKFCQLLREKMPQVAIVGLSNPEYARLEDFRSNSGAVEILSRQNPFEEFGNNLRKSFRFVWEKSFSVILGVSGVKAGVGATYLSALLGTVLGQKHPKRVLCVDLHRTRGDLAFLIGAQPNRDLSTLLQQEHFLSPEVFLHYISTANPGCAVIASGQELHAKPLDELALTALLTGFGNFFRYIVLDFPPYPFYELQSIADLCDHLFFNTGDTLNQIKRTYQMCGDLQKLPKSFLKRITLVSQSKEIVESSEISGMHSRICCIPKSEVQLFSNRGISLYDLTPAKPVIQFVEKLLEPYGVTSSNPPPPSLIRYLKSFFGIKS